MKPFLRRGERESVTTIPQESISSRRFGSSSFGTYLELLKQGISCYSNIPTFPQINSKSAQSAKGSAKMRQQTEAPGKSVTPRSEEVKRKEYYSRLHRKFILITLICSLVPLLLVGWIINIHYTRFARDKMQSSFQAEVENHRRIIELFLRERCSKLHLLAQTHSKEYLGRMDNLVYVFEIMNQEYGAITDIGVISEQGRHLAYVGPYDLMDKNYSETLWFKRVMEKGSYISDMFSGFRKVPHFIIAIARQEKGEKWILRATIDTEAFRSLVENVRIGKTGEVYLVNAEGYYQTSPRLAGKIMERTSMAPEPYHEGIKVRTIHSKPQDTKEKSRREIIATTWIREPQWMLVVKQEYSEAFDDVNYANYATLVFLHLSAITILIVTVLITRHLINVIRKRDEEADQLNQQLLEVGKMASLGELSAGVAHEINNPLAIILTERQILLDIAQLTPNLDEAFKKELANSLAQIDLQVNRCKRITHNLLRFSRRTKSIIETVDLNSFLGEVVELMEREARSAGIRFITSLDKSLKPVQSDPSQLQQVFLNLITNAIDAHDGKPYGSITIATEADDRMRKARIRIADTGSGISKENLSKIFDPFFTTKPVGKGTGLGLSLCYGITRRLGGTISVESELGDGTEFTIELPYKSSPGTPA